MIEINKNIQEIAHNYQTTKRPWGNYTVIEEGARFKIKKVEVNPGSSLSLRMHHHRSEHWIVVKGMAKIINNDVEILLRTGESTYIPSCQRYQLENPGISLLEMIEVQSGHYIGEDDIVPLTDC